MNWLDVLSVVSIALLVVPVSRGGSVGDQMLGTNHSGAVVRRPGRRR